MISDLVWVALITAGGPLVGLWIKDRFDKKRAKAAQDKLDKVEANTNGLVSHLVKSKDAEIKTTGELEKEKGKSEAKAEAKIEIDKLNKDSNPEKDKT